MCEAGRAARFLKEMPSGLPEELGRAGPVGSAAWRVSGQLEQHEGRSEGMPAWSRNTI